MNGASVLLAAAVAVLSCARVVRGADAGELASAAAAPRRFCDGRAECRPKTSLDGCEQYDDAADGPTCGDDDDLVYACCGKNAGTAAEAEDARLTEQNGDMTYYDLGLTACGEVYTNDDMVAALAFDWFTTPNPNEDPMCGRQVRITDPATSNSVVVEIRDKCQACQHDDIDVSPAAFQTLQPLEVGRYKVTWDFI